MQTFRATILSLFMMLPASLAFSEPWELTCKMTDYKQSGYDTGKSLKVAKSWIPEETVHIIEFPGTQLTTWGNVFGTAEFGDTIKLVYKFENNLSVVTYTYFPKSNVVIGRADFSGFIGIKGVRGKCRLVR